jgi:hypothetical protein
VAGAGQALAAKGVGLLAGLYQGPSPSQNCAGKVNGGLTTNGSSPPATPAHYASKIPRIFVAEGAQSYRHDGPGRLQMRQPLRAD